MRSDGQYVLQIEALTINLATAARPVTIVDKISFAVERHRTLCIVGESGCGKTLTARAIMRLLDPPLHIDAATRIMLDGRDLMTFDDTAMRRVRGAETGMIFLEPMSLLTPVYTVADQVAEPLVVHAGLARRTAYTRAEDLFRLVGRDRPYRRAA